MTQILIYAAGSYTNYGRVLLTRDGGKSGVEILMRQYSKSSIGHYLNPLTALEVVIGWLGER